MATHKNFVIGLDSSTTACKAIVWDSKGRLIAEGRSSIPLEQPYPAWHEQPAKSWWSAAAQALQQITTQIETNRLAALCISPQRETFVPLNASGQPLRKAIIWMDERCAPLLPHIKDQLGATWIHHQTGKPLSGNLSLGKIAWIKAYEPHVFAQTHKYLDVAGYLNHCLTGFYRTGWGCVDPMGLFDMSRQQWSTEILTFLGITQEQLPEPFPPGSILGEVTTAAARQTGLPAGLPVVAGVGDGQAAGLGTNITQPGMAYLILGTSVISGTYSNFYQTNETHRTMFGAIPNSYMLETAILGGGYTITWFVEKIAQGLGQDIQTDLPIEAMFNQAANHIAPGADGLMLVPYWNSVMNPYWDALASGIVVGWRGYHTLQHLYRAILEGIGFELKLHGQGIESAMERSIDKFVAVGGGTKSGVWCQIIANITGKPIYLSTTSDASSLGAAIQAAYGAGLFADMPSAAAAMTRINPTPFLPNQAQFEFYCQLYDDVYLHLFPALQPYLAKLTRLTATTP
jgi:xylulokinase